MTKLLLKLWLTVVAALLPASISAALTQADLEGMVAAHVTIGNHSQHGAGIAPYSGIIRINSSGAMYIENFMGSYNIACDLMTNNGVQYFRIKMSPYDRLTPHATGGVTANKAIFRPTSIDSQWNGLFSGNYGEPLCPFDLYPTSTQYLYGRIIDHGYYYTVNLDGCDPSADDYGMGFFVSYYNSNNRLIGNEVYSGLRLTIFKANAEAVDYKNGVEVDRYPVQLTKYVQNGNDRLEIGNFMNNGSCLEVTPGSLSSYRWATAIGNPDASIDYDNQTISIDEIGANFEIDYYYYGENTLSSGWTDYTAYWTGHDGTYGTQYYFCGDTNPQSTVATHAPITGSFESYDGLSHINYDENAWVTNDGTVRTKTGGWMLELNGTAYHDGSTILDRVDRTEIQPLDTEDVTADFILDIKQYSAYDLTDKGEFRIQADVVPQNHCDNVESYDLYIVPKAMTSINEFESGKHSYQTGHADAVLLDSKPASEARAAAGTAVVSFDKEYTLTGSNFNKNLNNYSLFVKANYKPVTELDPTFHQLTPLTDVVITSIGLTGADSDIAVVAGNGTITVEGAETVAVYTTTGTEVYNGPAGVIEVAPGIYVVNASGKVKKVIVK